MFYAKFLMLWLSGSLVLRFILKVIITVCRNVLLKERNFDAIAKNVGGLAIEKQFAVGNIY